ncbi:MAG: zinc-ribbon domain-containing protein [Candidatus Lokiarchaeota archaeon]|nr:zinc-ribbon domain-containing protein [Candidatus Lokiarchaeota archaeon]MBD3200438.1 zinc-ribbon domain-containing protein [Candidatus Lokiarchaeota archaeon]
MNYCPNCGGEVKDKSKYCILCGYDLVKTEIDNSKDERIKELEEKIARLEKTKANPSSQDGTQTNSWMFIMPIFIVAFFFLFIFMIVFITR